MSESIEGFDRTSAYGYLASPGHAIASPAALKGPMKDADDSAMAETGEWVSLREAADEVGVSITTVRDWTRSGDITLRNEASGRLVDLHEVRAKAMGPTALRRQSDLYDRVADGTERAAAGHDADNELASILLGLQELARERNP